MEAEGDRRIFLNSKTIKRKPTEHTENTEKETGK